MSQILATTPSKVVAEYGAFYRPGTPGLAELQRLMFSKSDIKVLFNTKMTENTRIDKLNPTLTSVLQPFYNRFSPNGVFDVVPNPWNLDQVKINVELEPDVLAATALDFFVQKGNDRSQAPIVQTIAEYLIQKAKEDDELYVAFNGVQVTPLQAAQDARTAGPVAASRNGVKHYIRGYNTATTSNAIASGAVPTDPALFVAYIEDFYYSIPEEKRGFIKWISVSDTLLTRFKRGVDIKYNGNYARTGGDNELILNTAVRIRGFQAQRGSSMIWTSFPENCIGFMKNGRNANGFAIDVHELYQVQMGTDWWEGYNFINPEYIWHNDQDLV
jgi:hypothetical protein